MTTAASASLAGPTAQAMARAHAFATQGWQKGSFPCPRCGSTVRFTCLGQPHQHRGQCAAACGVRWAT